LIHLYRTIIRDYGYGQKLGSFYSGRSFLSGGCDKLKPVTGNLEFC